MNSDPSQFVWWVSTILTSVVLPLAVTLITCIVYGKFYSRIHRSRFQEELKMHGLHKFLLMIFIRRVIWKTSFAKHRFANHI